jgi:hypothetical protein
MASRRPARSQGAALLAAALVAVWCWPAVGATPREPGAAGAGAPEPIAAARCSDGERAPPGNEATAPGNEATAPRQVTLYLARRSWHIDVGFAVRDLCPSLAFIAHRFPQAQYVFFGFGDRHYLLAKGKGTSTLAGALFPGPGMILVTALENSPSQAFGAQHVLEFTLPAPQTAAAQDFVRRELAGAGGESRNSGDIPPVAAGPYEGSVYYAAVARYSALHTCNTWAAEALKAAGLRVHSRLVVFAAQLWNQARKIGAPPRAAVSQGVLAPRFVNLNRRAADCRSDKSPWSSIPAGPPPWSSAGEAGSSC